MSVMSVSARSASQVAYAAVDQFLRMLSNSSLVSSSCTWQLVGKQIVYCN